MSTVKELVEKYISENFIVIFSKTYCPYCKMAKNTLTDLRQDYAVVELDEKDNGNEIQNYLLQKTGQRTVPNIFIAQTHVGGSDDLNTAKENGALAKLLTPSL
jgi:glutaredoxin 3